MSTIDDVLVAHSENLEVMNALLSKHDAEIGRLVQRLTAVKAVVELLAENAPPHLRDAVADLVEFLEGEV